MGDVTHEQANLMLRLYDSRRESRLREAREWFLSSFLPTSVDDLMQQAPPGSKENASMRMVVSYWEMVASIVNRGLIDEEFFFENSGEQWFVWERLKPVVEALRSRHKNPLAFRQLEQHVKRLEAWREKNAPGAVEATRQMIKQQSAQKMKTA